MKKILGIFFAFAMMLSVAFIADATGSNNSFSAQAQTRRSTVTIKRKRTGGIVGGAKYVGRKTYQGGKYVTKKTYQGGKYVTKKTVQGTKYAAHKTKRGAKATVSRTKKIILGN